MDDDDSFIDRSPSDPLSLLWHGNSVVFDDDDNFHRRHVIKHPPVDAPTTPASTAPVAPVNLLPVSERATVWWAWGIVVAVVVLIFAL